MKKIKLNNLKKIFTKEFIKDFLLRVKEHDIMTMAYQVTYNLLLAVIPTFVIIINILIPVMSENISFISNSIYKLPGQIQPFLHSIVDFIINQRSTGILSVGVLAAFFTASRGVKAMTKAFDKSFNKGEDRSFIKTQVLSIFFTMLIALVIGALIFAMATGPVILKRFLDIFKIPKEFINESFINLLRLTIPLGVMILVFTAVYTLAASDSIKNLIPIKPAFIGGLLATALCSLITVGYSIYVSNFSNMQSIYGPLVGIMIFLIWLNYIVLSVLVSGEFTATILHQFYDYGKKEDELTTFIHRQKDYHDSLQ